MSNESTSSDYSDEHFYIQLAESIISVYLYSISFIKFPLFGSIYDIAMDYLQTLQKHYYIKTIVNINLKYNDFVSSK